MSGVASVEILKTTLPLKMSSGVKCKLKRSKGAAVNISIEMRKGGKKIDPACLFLSILLA